MECYCVMTAQLVNSLARYCALIMSWNHLTTSTSLVCSGNENTGHPPDARGNTSYDISTPVAQIDIPNSTVSGNIAHLDNQLILSIL